MLFIFRRHFITARRGLFALFFFIAVGIAPLLIWQISNETVLVSAITFTLGLLIMAYYYILWYFTIYIVTNQRIRQIYQKGFFKKTEIDLDLANIQAAGISYTVPGFFATVFRYGTIIIQTVVGDLVVSYVSQPERVRNKLQNAVNEASRKRDNESTQEKR